MNIKNKQIIFLIIYKNFTTCSPYEGWVWQYLIYLEWLLESGPVWNFGGFKTSSAGIMNDVLALMVA